jgi:PAS domain S-box-containing protein
MNAEGYFVEMNDSFLKALGYSKEELRETMFLTLIHPDDIEITRKELNFLENSKQSANFENRYLTKTGDYLTLSWQCRVDPEVELYFSSARDVTKLRNESNKLAQIEAALKDRSIMSETDPAGIITYVNDNFCAISGYSKEELVGASHRIINSGMQDDAFFADMWQTISSKETWQGVITNRNKKGELYFVNITIIPIIDNADEISSYLAIRYDITDNIQQKNDLAKTLKILNETNAIAKIGGWEFNVKTDVMTRTDEAFRILKLEKSEGLSPSIEESLSLFIPEHQVLIQESLKRAISHGEPYDLELQRLTEEGNKIWININGKPNYVDGKVISVSGTVQDIDEKKKTELKYNLERQKSIQSSKLASLGELAASMAHEINNPLGIISGYSELMMLDNDMSDGGQSKLQVILKSCDRISHIVNNLRRFSRTESELQYKNISLNTVVNEVISLARPRLKRGLVNINFDDELSFYILGNTIEIEQVFLNLINNSIDAVKNLPEKWIEITQIQKEDNVEIRIADSGSGIKEQEYEKIFSPFYTSKKSGEGTGLGLSIVDSILNDHGASIKYDEMSKHTCFKLIFRISKES